MAFSKFRSLNLAVKKMDVSLIIDGRMGVY
jgi:hypothetical protein